MAKVNIIKTYFPETKPEPNSNKSFSLKNITKKIIGKDRTTVHFVKN